MELTYRVKDRPPVGRLILFAFQQILSVIAGTITLPLVIGNGMSQSAALLGASIGTIVYLLFTKFKSPVLLGSSFSYVGSMSAAFAGAASMSIGYAGLLLGAILSGLIYVGLAFLTKYIGTKWIDKVMPPVVIGPTVAIIGLVLAPQAIFNLSKGSVLDPNTGASVANDYICILVGLITLFTATIVAVHAKGTLKMIPFIIGILVGYLVAAIFTWIGTATNNSSLMIIDFSLFKNIQWDPELSFLKAIDGFKEFKSAGEFFTYFGMIALAFIPISFVSFAEHIADHKNLSFIIGENLIEDPGLYRTLLGDGIGSIVGATLGGCPNTTYGESISCVAVSKNASTITILTASLISIVIAFIAPLMTFFKTIPTCIVGGLSICLYGFIATSGFRMLKDVDLNKPRNIFVVATILIVGVGGLAFNFNEFTISSVAIALALGVFMNVVLGIHSKKKEPIEENNTEDNTKEE